MWKAQMATRTRWTPLCVRRVERSCSACVPLRGGATRERGQRTLGVRHGALGGASAACLADEDAGLVGHRPRLDHDGRARMHFPAHRAQAHALTRTTRGGDGGAQVP